MTNDKRSSISGKSNSEAPLVHLCEDIPEMSLKLAEHIIKQRARRGEFFGREIFGEAGWDMLLAVYISHGRGYRLNVSHVCFESGAPQTTALRWLDHIEREGLVERRKSLNDGRTAIVTMTPQGIDRMNRYLEEVRRRMS